jgi:hypothetical protein
MGYTAASGWGDLDTPSEMRVTAADQARARDQQAMAAYERQMDQYERDLAAYSAKSKEFAATKTGFQPTAAPINVQPTAALTSFDLNTNWGPNSLLSQAIAQANPVVAPKPAVARPAVSMPKPVAPTMPTMPTLTAPRTGVPEGWTPSVGSDGWGGMLDGSGTLAGIGLDMGQMGQAYDSYISANTQPQQGGFFSNLSTPGLIGGALGLVAGGPVGALGGYGLGSFAENAYNAVQNPSGFFDSLSVPGLVGGALGAVVGGPVGAFGGYNLGSLAERAYNGLGGLGGLGGWDGWDASTYGYGAGYNSRGERSHTGEDRSGNATRGDGSYSEAAGYNDNSPQGIL